MNFGAYPESFDTETQRRGGAQRLPPLHVPVFSTACWVRSCTVGASGSTATIFSYMSLRGCGRSLANSSSLSSECSPPLEGSGPPERASLCEAAEEEAAEQTEEEEFNGSRLRAMEEGSEVVEDIVFRGVEFSVKIEVEKGLLIVEISDAMTADQWRGDFDPAYIEDLTRKTGNFKQFPIFCSMLESAVRKMSDSVTLDLLTYADLELLRNRKAGVVSRPRGNQQSSALTAKRYLILIYTVEFDRIHYPLPLPYVGKLTPPPCRRKSEL
ncbi:hypothetical protein F7725_007059 [Dissostichus mawsoni]|uniref:Centrosomal protein CCDC61 n=1 Tax=Dissostichus mawsoni TaxID=36200 RepID=A0A7J5XXA6_DISMA|nr:hypothetical protein F7725_007059 [Dissostichus mawsoni]